jgi:hypothetical protein
VGPNAFKRTSIKNKQEKYIEARIKQLMDDMNNASDEYDKQWYNRIIQELTWVRDMSGTESKTNCYMEKTHVGAIGGKEIWT